METVKSFKKKYVKALREDTAAIFAGSGLSIPAGYVNWKGLLKEIAEELGLDVQKEHDLVALAQFHRNEKGNRGILNQEIINQFTKDFQLSNNHRILARLPIKYYWTTNYDTLLEKALEGNNKKVDVKIIQDNLATNLPRRNAIVYKMHGDISQPSDAVITKDDYESYNTKRQLFTTTLQGDLISKTFLFIGFSFDDPNLEYILSRIRVLLGENKREHYAFFKKLKENDFKSRDEFIYNETRQRLRINDLKRYAISAVMIDEYKEIEEILSDIEKLFNLNKIFISGSADDYGSWNESEAKKLMHNLSKEVVKKDYKIVSGFGLGVGSVIINGALEEIYDTKYKNTGEYLELRPFPQIHTGKKSLKELWDEYRRDMISKSGVVIILFGNKLDGGNIINAQGVYKEFEIAKEFGLSIIPVGSTGFMAKEIFNEMKNQIKEYEYLEKYLDVLLNSEDCSVIINAIMEIIGNLTTDYLN